jgi:carbon-monoxide dehydrogenase medium subunit
MIPYPFEYRRANSVAEAQMLFAQSAEGKYLAGGQTLIPTMKLRLASPAQLIDIANITELSFVEVGPEAVVVGAGVKHAAVAGSAEISATIPALAELAEMIGDPAVRHMGTLGGSLANNDPAADYPAAALGLGATIRTHRRKIGADAFFTGMFSTALEEDEIITAVEFPIPARAAYMKFPNPASRYALAGVFVAQAKHGVRVAVTGAAPCVFRQREMEAALARDFRPEAIAAIKIAPDNLNSDIHASAEYRAHLVTVMAKRAVAAALRGHA